MNSLADITILLAAAVLAVTAFKYLGLGSVLGYLVAGVLIGPFGLGRFTEVESILRFSEIGIVLLLFMIGLELEPKRLWVLRKAVFGVGALQVGVTTVVLAAVGARLGYSHTESLVAGFALALSSTAFVMQLLGERTELLQSYGRASFGVLLFQDLAVIPFLALMPLLKDSGEFHLDADVLIAIGRVVGAFVVVGLAGVLLVRPAFRLIAASKNHEIFTAAALLVVLGTALFMSSVGLSMSLGAFMAGVLLANSEYRHEIRADIEPFEGLLLGLFFVAVGMAANLDVIVEEPVALVTTTLGVMAIKAVILYSIGRYRHDREHAVRLALALPQCGEFGFVLFSMAVSEKLLTRATADFLVMVVTLSMACTPLTFKLADFLARRLAGSEKPAYDRIEEPANPVIIAGFGRFGQIVARVLRTMKIGFTALEASHVQVDFVRRYGNKIYYGDASRLDLLRAAEADKAKIFVLAIDDVATSVRTAALVKRNFPQLKIYARVRNRTHAYQLMELGVDYIMRETYVSSLEMTEAVLRGLGIHDDEAYRAVQTFRDADERQLIASQAIYQDEAKLIESSKEFVKELETLFERDVRR